METASDDGRPPKVERVFAPKRRTVSQGTYRVQLPLALELRTQPEALPGNSGWPFPDEKGECAPKDPVTETPRSKAIDYLQDIFANAENVVGRRFPALEAYIEAADIEVQRDFYRLLNHLLSK